jgi:hypothetical protein
LSAGNATLACGYEGSAFQAAVLNNLTFSPNNLTFSPNGLDFHNRRRAIALPAALRKRGTCPNGQNASVVFVLPIRAKITFATPDSHYLFTVTD